MRKYRIVVYYGDLVFRSVVKMWQERELSTMRKALMSKQSLELETVDGWLYFSKDVLANSVVGIEEVRKLPIDN